MRMSYPPTPPASAEYAYADPKTACYAFARLPQTYHPLDAWKLMGKEPPSFSRCVFPIWFATMMGVGSVCYQNRHNQKPIWSGFHRHILATMFLCELRLHDAGWYPA